MKRVLLSCLIGIALSSCAQLSPQPESRVERLALWLSGSFSSAAQAQRDASYFDVRLHVAPIWTGRDDGPWLYVEQALGAQLDQPYRQRVYRLLELPDGRVESQVYELPAPKAVIGAWRDPGRFPLAGPEPLLLRSGCAVRLQDAGTRFVGATEGKSCASALRGASYATSEVILDANRIQSWDRGYDSGDQQVWGAVGGAYEFVRQAD